MTGKERILAVIKGEIPDRTPFVPALTPFFLKTLPKAIRTDDPIEACRLLKVDIIERWIPTFKGFHLNGDWNQAFYDPQILKDAAITVSEIKKENYIYRTYDTPVGTLNEKISENEIAGATSFHEEPMIKNIEDLKPYQYLWEAKSANPIYNETQKILDYIGDDGIGTALIPSTPIIHLIMYDLGIQKLIFFLEDYPEKMKKLLKIMEEKSFEAARIAVDSPAEVGLIAENSGTLLVSPKQFSEYCKPVIAEYCKIFKQNNKHVFMHACGHLKGLLDQIVEIKDLSGIESLTPPPTGDVTLEYSIKNMWPNKMTIIGGMDPVTFLFSKPEKIEKLVRTIIKKVKPGRNFMLMPSDSTAADTPVENFHAVNRIISSCAENI